MGLFDFLRSRKKKRKALSENVTNGLQSLDDADLSGIVPPETRFTEEYREFLASQEAAENRGLPDDTQEEAAENVTDGLQSLDDAGLSGIVPPETRFTEEYREFLASQEAAENRELPADTKEEAAENRELPADTKEEAAESCGPAADTEEETAESCGPADDTEEEAAENRELPDDTEEEAAEDCGPAADTQEEAAEDLEPGADDTIHQ